MVRVTNDARKTLFPPERHFRRQSLVLGRNERPPADTEAGGWRLLAGVDSSGAGGFGAGGGAREECVLVLLLL